MARLVFRYQAYLFFPLLLLEAISLHAASIRALTSRASRHRPLESGAARRPFRRLPCFVFLVLSPVKAVVFIVVQQGLFGLYLGCSFAPNHKGMPILDAGDQTDFLRRQVLTSRNVRGGWLTDFALGGLNYQIEHHLFPSMPRPNLRRSQALVRAFCQQQDLPYCQTSLAGSYAQALRHLNTVGRPARPGTVTSPVPQPGGQPAARAADRRRRLKRAAGRVLRQHRAAPVRTLPPVQRHRPHQARAAAPPGLPPVQGTPPRPAPRLPHRTPARACLMDLEWMGR